MTIFLKIWRGYLLFWGLTDIESSGGVALKKKWIATLGVIMYIFGVVSKSCSSSCR